jgi:exodeoxyribonuclease VII large subunit
VNGRLVTWRNLASRLRQVRPKALLKQRRDVLQTTQKRLHELARVQFKNLKNALQTSESRLRLLGPEQVLARGYSITLDMATGKVLRDTAQVKSGQRLKTRLKKGEVSSRVE